MAILLFLENFEKLEILKHFGKQTNIKIWKHFGKFVKTNQKKWNSLDGCLYFILFDFGIFRKTQKNSEFCKKNKKLYFYSLMFFFVGRILINVKQNT